MVEPLNTDTVRAEQRLEVGPVADALLKSLRTFEQAKDYYFTALETMCGEDWANEQYARECDIFAPVTELIERRLHVAVSDWAVSRPARNTI
jgi:hypothetical protein